MSGGNNNNNGMEAPKKCGLTELLLFLAAVLTGTACSICSKTMMQMQGTGITGDQEVFGKPIFQTFGMFVGMLFGLVMHYAVLYFQIPFPGYNHSAAGAAAVDTTTTTKNGNGKVPTETDRLLLPSGSDNKDAVTTTTNTGVPAWMYWFLMIPSLFDLMATALCMMGLLYLDVSIYQLLRGSGIIFVALMKQHVLGDSLYTYQWLGVAWNVASVILVGATAILNETTTQNDDIGGDDTTLIAPAGQALLGVLLVMAGAFVQALQFVFEEKVMTMDEAAVPPLLLIGMEGFWGSLLCLVVVYPVAYYLPGSDHGSYEDPFNTFYMLMHNDSIQWSFLIYFLCIFSYNLFAVLVTFSLSSIWHAILDNFRPISVWTVDLLIFYYINPSFGEQWNQPWSWLQVFGLIVLLYGTAVYNAPHAGSISLTGEWYHFGIDLRQEYQAVEAHMQEVELDAEWQRKQEHFKNRRASSLAERSPYLSVHTQALRGLANAHGT